MQTTPSIRAMAIALYIRAMALYKAFAHTRVQQSNDLQTHRDALHANCLALAARRQANTAHEFAHAHHVPRCALPRGSRGFVSFDTLPYLAGVAVSLTCAFALVAFSL